MEKSVTLANLCFPRETVNKSSFPRTKHCSVTTAIFCKNGARTILVSVLRNMLISFAVNPLTGNCTNMYDWHHWCFKSLQLPHI